jgi:DNA-binding CsgD family transcriptional regulator
MMALETPIARGERMPRSPSVEETPSDGRQGEAMIADLLRFSAQEFSSQGAILSWANSSQPGLGARAIGLTESFIGDYLSGASRSDPFVRNDTFINEINCLSELTGSRPGQDFATYQSFIARHGYRDEIDMVLQHEDYPSVVLALFGAHRLRFDRTAAGHLQVFLASNMARRPFSRRLRRLSTLRSQLGLTARELDVVELVCQGATNKDIAAELGIGLATVKTHVLRVLDKIGVGSRSELAATMNQI